MTSTCASDIARRNSIVYRCLTPSPSQALLFGNGAMGGMVHTPDDSLYLQVARGDTWNERACMGAMAAVRVRGNEGLFTQATAVRQECNLSEATIRIALQTPDGEVAFAVICLRGTDLVLLRIDDRRTRRSDFLVSLENWHEGESVVADGDQALETAHENRTSCFPEMNRRVNVDAAALGIADPLLGRSWALAVGALAGRVEGKNGLRLAMGKSHEIRIATACVAPKPGVDALRTARETCRALARASSSDVASWRREHDRYWKEFWAQSWVSLYSDTGDAEYEERLWYVTLYTIACGSGGRYPLRFNGGPYLLDRDRRSWDGGYWFQNMREVYWPLLASGHWEFMHDLFRLYFEAQPFVRAQTKNVFGIDALCYRETQAFWGLDVDTDLAAQRFNPVTRHYFSSNTECGLLMEWYWRASGDEAFLRETLYPFLRGVLEFFQRYATRDDSGMYHLSPVNSLETWVDVQDDMPNLCGLHYFLPRAISWGEQLGEEEAVLDRWRDFREHLAPLPVGRWTVTRKFQEGIHSEEQAVRADLDPEGLFLPAAALPAGKSLRCNMENAEMYVVFPWGIVGMDSPAKEVRRVENTWTHRTWPYPNNGWAQDAVQLARMGWADRARESLLDHASYAQRFPNGCFISAASAHFHGLVTDTPYFDSAGVHATALNEMLLQSYDGIIRIAPAVSAEWNGQFKLHALDGFAVEASFVHGRPATARVTAVRDGRLRVRNCSCTRMQAGSASFATWETLDMHLQKGQTIDIRWEGVPTGNSLGTEPPPDVVWPGYKIRPPRSARASGHWHDERKGHGQVGLAEDGLFPATRTN